jgi:putative protein-disulfide isomerase
VGLDVASFIKHLTDGSAESAFSKDLELTHKYGVRGFPTFLFRFREREVMLRGYQPFPAMQATIETLAVDAVQGRAPDRGAEDLLAFLRRYGRAAPVELATVFDLKSKEVDTILAKLSKENLVRGVEAGNGWFWEPLASGPVCDPQTGTCRL